MKSSSPLLHVLSFALSLTLVFPLAAFGNSLKTHQPIEQAIRPIDTHVRNEAGVIAPAAPIHVLVPLPVPIFKPHWQDRYKYRDRGHRRGQCRKSYEQSNYRPRGLIVDVCPESRIRKHRIWQPGYCDHNGYWVPGHWVVAPGYDNPKRFCQP